MNAHNLRHGILSTTIAALVGIAVCSTASAANLHWDGNDTTANADGGPGIWNTLNANWDAAATGGVNTNWNNGTPDFAIFGGAAGIVTLGEDMTAAGIRFATSGYTIDTSVSSLILGGASNTITLSNTNAAGYSGTTGFVGQAAINGPIVGTGSVRFATWAFVTLNSSNSPLPGTTLLTLNGNSAGTLFGSVTMAANTAVNITDSNQAFLNTPAINLRGGGITLTNNSSSALLDRVSDTAPITSNGGTITFANTDTAATAYAETLGSVSLLSGNTTFSLSTLHTASDGQMLILSGLTRTGAANTSAVHFQANTSLDAAKNIIRVAGAAATPAGQIIGPWATVGTTVTVSNDYAVFDASGNVLPANTGSTTNGSWTNATDAYTLNTGTIETLSATRTITALRFFGAVSTLALDTHRLETHGLLLPGANIKTVTTGVGGALTTPAGGGSLFLTASQNVQHVISGAITDNSGAVTLVKSGIGSVLLGANNTYTGGTVLNGGTLVIGPNVTSTFLDTYLGDPGVVGVSLGAPVIVNSNASIAAQFNAGGGNFITMNRAIEINNEAILRFNVRGDITITGPVTGTGGMINGNPNAQGNTWTLSSTANTFTGPVFLNLTNNQPNNLVVNSMADGYGRIVMNAGTGAATFRLGAGATAPLVFNERQFEVTGLVGATGNVQIENVNAAAANTITVNTDFINTALAPTRILVLTGTNTGDNTFAGRIGNGSTAVTALTKTGTGAASKWVLSGDNSYTGATNVAVGILNIRHANALGSTTGSTTVANAGQLELQGGISFAAEPLILTPGTAGGTGLVRSISGNNTWNGPITANTATASHVARIQSDSDKLTLAGPVSITGSAYQFVLQGDGQIEVSGQITGVGRITSSNGGTGTRTISNDTNNFTGQVAVNGGVLAFTSIANVGAASSALGAPALADSIITTGNANFTGVLRYLGTAPDGHTSDRVINLAGTTGGATIEANGVGPLALTSATTATGAGIKTLTLTGANAGDNSIGAIVDNTALNTTSLLKDGLGKWVLTGANTYTGATTINGGTLLVNGSLSGSSVVTVNTGGTLGGTGVIGGITTVANGGKLSPGASAGTLTFGGDLDLSAVNTAGSLIFELGTTSDLVTLTTGTLLIGSETLGFGDFAFSNAGGLTEGTYTLFDTATPILGDLDPLNLSGSIGAFIGTLGFADGGNDIVLTVVPEPGSFVLLGLGAFAMLRRRSSR